MSYKIWVAIEAPVVAGAPTAAVVDLFDYDPTTRSYGPISRTFRTKEEAQKWFNESPPHIAKLKVTIEP